MTDTPEIDALRSSRLTAEEIYWIAVNHPDDLFAPWDDAIQAVRDTELRIAAEWQGYRYPVEQIRREAFREAVEALRAADDGGDGYGSGDWAAVLIERTFLSPDNPEATA